MSYSKKCLGILLIFCIFSLIYMWSQKSKIFEVEQIVKQVNHPELCQNLLSNITNGRWIREVELLSDKSSKKYLDLIAYEEEIDSHLNDFRIKRGIHTRLWRNDGKCGIENLQDKPKNSKWAGHVAAWCDAKSNEPCCSDEKNGTCGTECECSSCIDMRKILHAEISKWIPLDSRCHPRNYTSVEACDVIRRFNDFYFVGDSFVRKVARIFILTLRSDPVYGALMKSYNTNKTKFCIGTNQLYWTECNLAGGRFSDILRDNGPICGKDLSKFYTYKYYNIGTSGKFLNLIKKLAGKEGSVVFLGVGVHMRCDFNLTKTIYIDPAIQYLIEFHRSKERGVKSKHSMQWPHIVFMFPDSSGLLKPPRYQALNGKSVCNKYSDQMKSYFNEHNISVMDFRKLTSDVHSYDGTHHGVGVNLMKFQLLLNHLEYISQNMSDTKSF